MKKFIIAFLIPLCAQAQMLFQDTFDSNPLNTSTWNTSFPFSDSNLNISNGILSLSDGAGILTKASFNQPIDVDFSFEFIAGQHDSFRVVTRADSFNPNGYGIQHWVGISFRIQEDTGNRLGNVAIEDTGTVLSLATIALTNNALYNIKLRDDGKNIQAFWDGSDTPFLSVLDTSVYGSHIGSFNREGAGNYSFISAGSTSGINSITVTAIPEPSAYGALAGCVVLSVALYRKRKGWRQKQL